MVVICLDSSSGSLTVSIPHTDVHSHQNSSHPLVSMTSLLSHASNQSDTDSGRGSMASAADTSWVGGDSCHDNLSPVAAMATQNNEAQQADAVSSVLSHHANTVCKWIRLSYLAIMIVIKLWIRYLKMTLGTLEVVPGHPLSPLSIPFLVFCSFLLFPFLSGFNYFLLLSIPFLSTRIVPLRFEAGGRRKRPNLGLVCCVYFVLSVFLS